MRCPARSLEEDGTFPNVVGKQRRKPFDCTPKVTANRATLGATTFGFSSETALRIMNFPGNDLVNHKTCQIFNAHIQTLLSPF